MTVRSHGRLRRDLRRAIELCKQHAVDHAVLSFLLTELEKMNELVEIAWQGNIDAQLSGDVERDERAYATRALLTKYREVRPLVLVVDEGAAQNLKSLPSGAATPDDLVAVVNDLVTYVQRTERCASLRPLVAESLVDLLASAKKETSEAAEALRKEAAASDLLTETMIKVNTVLVRGLSVIRAAFGSDSVEYRQFMLRNTAKEEQEDDDILFPAKDDAA